MPKVLIEHKGDIGIVRLNDPEVLNAVSAAMLDQFAEAMDYCASRSRTVVISAIGRAFCSGANLAGDLMVRDEAGYIDPGVLLETHVNPLIEQIVAYPVPLIAAVRGAVAGVGCSLALAADLVVASETTLFIQAFAKVGLVPDGGSTWMLPRAIGRVRAMELMLLGHRLDARQALEWGLINRLVPDAALDETALLLADTLARGPTKTLGLIRRLAWEALETDLASTLATERSAQREAGKTHDAVEGTAAFTEKRAPRFTGN